jgi:hypothetical protein
VSGPRQEIVVRRFYLSVIEIPYELEIGRNSKISELWT